MANTNGSDPLITSLIEPRPRIPCTTSRLRRDQRSLDQDRQHDAPPDRVPADLDRDTRHSQAAKSERRYLTIGRQRTFAFDPC